MVTPAFLPYGRQLIEDDDVAAVAAALRADYLTTGPRVEAFERAFAERVGALTQSPAAAAPRRCTFRQSRSVSGRVTGSSFLP